MEQTPDEGTTPEKEIHNKEVFEPCPKCNNPVTVWKERVLDEGSLELYYVMHTEVDDKYECSICGHNWSKHRFL
ncbi:MAG: hypothetical protein K0S12_1956 [Bacteroidetes bacterium]|jgi:hypothetical protein|nr:hypothetical protein [Bacteroidota bacterium]